MKKENFEDLGSAQELRGFLQKKGSNHIARVEFDEYKLKWVEKFL